MPRRVTGAIAVGLLATTLTGCSALPGAHDCTPTSIEVADVSTDSETEPLALTARLTADGNPVSGAELSYYLIRSRDGEDQAPELAGSATTDADGNAELRYEGGAVDILAASSEVVEAYTAEYVSKGLIDDTRYCGSTSDSAVIDVPCAGFGCRW